MKRIILWLSVILIGVLVGMSISYAADVTLKWDVSVGATGYKIYKSEDMCVTWGAPVDVGNVTTYVYVGVNETKMVHFRVSAYNDNGESIRYWSGAWYNHLWKPVNSAGGTGIQ